MCYYFTFYFVEFFCHFQSRYMCIFIKEFLSFQSSSLPIIASLQKQCGQGGICLDWDIGIWWSKKNFFHRVAIIPFSRSCRVLHLPIDSIAVFLTANIGKELSRVITYSVA